jgi:hypothetical protein
VQEELHHAHQLALLAEGELIKRSKDGHKSTHSSATGEGRCVQGSCRGADSCLGGEGEGGEGEGGEGEGGEGEGGGAEFRWHLKLEERERELQVREMRGRWRGKGRRVWGRGVA